jgi:hypothetical protein
VPDLADLRREIAELDRKLSRYKVAPEAGTGPTLVASWSREVQVRRTTAQARLAEHQRSSRGARALTDDVAAIVRQLGGLNQLLRSAEPAARASR